MKKLCLSFATLFLVAPLSAMGIQLFDEYQVGQKIDEFSSVRGYVICPTTQWECRQKSDVFFAGMSDWQQYFYFQEGSLIKISLIRPLSKDAFYKVSGAILNAGFAPVIVGNGQKVAFDVIQSGKGKTLERLAKNFSKAERQLQNGTKLQYVFVSELNSPEDYKNVQDYEENSPNPALRKVILTLNEQSNKMTVSFLIPQSM